MGGVWDIMHGILIFLWIWAPLFQARCLYKYFTQLKKYQQEQLQHSNSSHSKSRIPIDTVGFCGRHLYLLSTITVVGFTLVLLNMYCLLFMRAISYMGGDVVTIADVDAENKSLGRTFLLIFGVTQSIFLTALTTLRVFRVVRLKISFEGSIYEMSNKLYIFLICAIGITVIQSVLAILIAIVSGPDESSSGGPRSLEIVVTLFGTSLLIQTLLDMFSCYLFNKNLLSLIVMQRKSVILHRNHNYNINGPMASTSRHDQPRINSVKSKSSMTNMTLGHDQVHSDNESSNININTNTRQVMISGANDSNSNININRNINSIGSTSNSNDSNICNVEDINNTGTNNVSIGIATATPTSPRTPRTPRTPSMASTPGTPRENYGYENKRENDKKESNNYKQEKIVFSEAQKQLLDTTAKQTVLTIVSTLMSVLAIIVIVIQTEVEFVLFVLLTLCTILSATVWLSFSFANKDYQNICQKGHNTFVYHCQKLAQFRINKINKRQSEALRNMETAIVIEE